MPRVLLATILVNMSWFLMAQLVDVSTIVISGVGQLTQSFMDKASFSTVTAQQLVQATPSEIRINDKGCLAVERNASSRDMESILNSRNHLLWPLIYLWGSIIKLQSFTIDELCADSSSQATVSWKSITLSVIFGVVIAIMFFVPLLVLTAYNLFRLIYIWWWILMSPLLIWVNLFDKELEKMGWLWWLKKLASVGTLMSGLFQPAFFVAALGLGMMFVTSMYTALSFWGGWEIDVASNTATNAGDTSQFSFGQLGTVTIVGSLKQDPTGTIGGWLWYILIVIATCMVLWMLVKLSFSISKENPASALGIDFDPIKLMDRMRNEMMKRVTLPKTGIWWPLDGASLAEATSLLDPTNKKNRIMKKIDDIANSTKQIWFTGEWWIDAANKWLENSRAGKLLGMQDNGDLSDDQSKKLWSIMSKASIKDAPGAWQDNTKNFFSTLKTYAKSSEDAKTFKADLPYRSTYKALKTWYEDSWWKEIINNMWLKEWEMDVKDLKFDEVYKTQSYIGWLIKYLATTDEVKLKDGKLDWWKWSKEILANIDFKNL